MKKISLIVLLIASTELFAQNPVNAFKQDVCECFTYQETMEKFEKELDRCVNKAYLLNEKDLLDHFTKKNIDISNYDSLYQEGKKLMNENFIWFLEHCEPFRRTITTFKNSIIDPLRQQTENQADVDDLVLIAKKSNDSDEKFKYFFAAGLLYEVKEEYDLALKYYKKSLQYKDNRGTRIMLALLQYEQKK